MVVTDSISSGTNAACDHCMTRLVCIENGTSIEHPCEVRRGSYPCSLAQTLDFNPRTHVECDKINEKPYGKHPEFQSTHSCRVRLRWQGSNCLGPSYFNPRTHVECDLRKIALFELHKNFNPRTHVECDGLLLWDRL